MAWGWRLSTVTFRCCLKTIPHTGNHSVFTTWKWHPFATWTPSFIILVWIKKIPKNTNGRLAIPALSTKSEHDRTTQKHMRKKKRKKEKHPIHGTPFESPSHGLQHTKLQTSSITLTESTKNNNWPNIGDWKATMYALLNVCYETEYECHWQASFSKLCCPKLHHHVKFNQSTKWRMQPLKCLCIRILM